MKIGGFNWDSGNRDKCGRHGVSLAEIEHVLTQDDLRVSPDPAHSNSEARFIGVGRTEEGRPVFVAFTIRRPAGATLIRPISARYMHRKEVERYEEDGA